MAFDKTSLSALFCEVKWKHLSEKGALNIIEDLRSKSKEVEGTWNPNYCLIAKKIGGKEKMDFLALDLDDIKIECT
ncbi:hypothetical protein [Methanolobus profundi]|uniref:hypothetical protein n=1 Tax=Methanolobus profundi TaxID=487685 RepID=UPI00373FDF95